MAPMIQRRTLLVTALLVMSCGVAPTAVSPLRPVTFIGDSITDQLGALATWFGPEAATWVNAGVAGDSAAGVLARVDQDVAPPAEVCVILVGINDIWGGAGDGGDIEDLVPPGTPANNFRSVGGALEATVDRLRARGVRPILSTLLPVAADYPHADVFNPKIVVLNAWLRSYARAHDVGLIDYFPAFVGADGTGIPALLQDGLHPNPDGQALLARIASGALREAGALR